MNNKIVFALLSMITLCPAADDESSCNLRKRPHSSLPEQESVQSRKNPKLTEGTNPLSTVIPAEKGECILKRNQILQELKDKTITSKRRQELHDTLIFQANNKDYIAQFCLAYAYESNLFLTADSKLDRNLRAVHWYIQSANEGYSYAQWKLYDSYYNGRGVNQDQTKAIDYLNQAVLSQNPFACLAMGALCLSGKDVPQDFSRASLVLNISLMYQATEARSAYLLYTMHNQGFYAGGSVAEAMRLLMFSAEKGCCSAQYDLGHRLITGNGVQTNHAEGIAFITLAADKGHASSCELLAQVYEHGAGTVIDYDRAFDFYLKAAGAGLKYAQYKVGYFYQQDRVSSLESNDLLSSYSDLIPGYSPFLPESEEGQILLSGEIDLNSILSVSEHRYNQRMQKARYWYTLSAEKGYVRAIVELAMMYLHGTGIPKDEPKARELFSKISRDHLVEIIMSRSK